MIHRIITPEWIKETMLVGIDLTDDDNVEYPDAHYIQAIDQAIASREALYDVPLRQNRQYVHYEAIDGEEWDVGTWYFKKVEKRPLISVDKYEIQFGAFAAYELPISWVQVVSKPAGQFQLVPGPEAFRGPYVTGGYPVLTLINRGHVPNWIRLQYTAGFTYLMDGTVTADMGSRVVTFTPNPNGTNPDLISAIQALKVGGYVYAMGETHRVADIVSATEFRTTKDIAQDWNAVPCEVMDYDPAMIEAISILASLPILDTAGDLIIGAGISNQSLSIDGLSQSIGTTSGVENSGYGARATQYRKRLEQLDHDIRRRYRTLNMAIF